jgi:hypothetical protein
VPSFSQKISIRSSPTFPDWEAQQEGHRAVHFYRCNAIVHVGARPRNAQRQVPSNAFRIPEMK